MASRVHPLRLALVTIVLLVTVVAVLLVDRTSRLARLVEVRTSSLAQLADDQRATIERFRDSQRALAASEARLRLSLAASSSATFEMDVETGAVDWSPEAAAIVGLVPAATIGDIAAFASHLESSDGQRVQLAFEQARSVASQATFELRTTVAADGAIRWVALHLISQADADGAIRRIVGTLTDITERRKLEEQFLHAQKMQAVGVLAGGVAHDFNNLLTVILGAGQMARAACDAADATESLRTDLDEVLLAGERAAILTGQLLAFSRRQVVQPTHFDIGALVRGTEPMLRRLVGEQIRTETRLPETPVPVFADQGQLTQVLMNLAVNAKDAMPAGGVLRIEVRTGGPPPGPARPDEVFAAKQYALLSVSDTGTGIDPLVQRRIFEPFFTTKPVGQGTGLGLPTVYGIARQFGGTVRFVTAPGEGSTFSVFIPMDETGASDASLGSVPPIAANGSGRTVLLVEDEAALRAMVARVLTDAAYEVLLAEDGVSALRQARERHGPIDLLVSDVTMPRLGGVELATVLSEERPRLRVLLMSGYPQREHNASAESLRGVSFIAKPFFPGELLMAVERALAAAD